MLTGDLVRPRLRKRGSQVVINLLPDNAKRQRIARDLIALFREHEGRPQYVWDAALEAFEGDSIDYVVIRGLAKVLADAATFEAVESPVAPATIRQRVFAQGPVFRTIDLFHQHTRDDVLAAVAGEFGVDPELVAYLLFADRPAEYVLVDTGPDWTPSALIARYNLELARGVLYWARVMHIDVFDSYKDFWRYLKLFKLMFWASPKPEGGYHVELDGPISPFVTSTTRYGRQFAAFLPALLLCDRWQMRADVRPPQFDSVLTYHLNDQAPLSSHFRRSGDFDSRMEADFAAEFHAKFGDTRQGWELTHEDEVILLGDTVMIPDFTLTHRKSGRRAVIEIVGFWHPEYLRRKVEKVRAAQRGDLILLVYEGVNLTPASLEDVPSQVLYFKNKPVLKDVMVLVEAVAK
jgi:predicted nuclease of restriction endonuclease-like RecB superfamily